MNDCRKCHKRLNECDGCHGRPNAHGLTCKRCSNTGLVCPDHGAHWK